MNTSEDPQIAFTTILADKVETKDVERLQVEGIIAESLLGAPQVSILTPATARKSEVALMKHVTGSLAPHYLEEARIPVSEVLRNNALRTKIAELREHVANTYRRLADQELRRLVQFKGISSEANEKSRIVSALTEDWVEMTNELTSLPVMSELQAYLGAYPLPTGVDVLNKDSLFPHQPIYRLRVVKTIPPLSNILRTSVDERKKALEQLLRAINSFIRRQLLESTKLYQKLNSNWDNAAKATRAAVVVALAEKQAHPPMNDQIGGDRTSKSA